MITFVTSDNGLDYAELTRESKRAYCEKYDYDFLPVDSTETKAPNQYWAQVEAMLLGLQQCDEWINYTGADSWIDPKAEDCKDLLYSDKDLIISCDKNGLNNNGFFLHRCQWSFDFLEKVWALRSDKPITVYHNGDPLVAARPNGMGHDWFEQSAFIQVLREPGMMEYVQIAPQSAINAYPHEIKPECENPKKPFIWHLPGVDNTTRLRFITKALNAGN